MYSLFIHMQTNYFPDGTHITLIDISRKQDEIVDIRGWNFDYPLHPPVSSIQELQGVCLINIITTAGLDQTPLS